MVVRSLDGFTLLYHRPSGQTHLVASPVPEIIQVLQKVDADISTLYEVLAHDFDLGDRAEAIAELTHHVDALVALGLIRPA
nr:HPr-rel-A system PqqD family peptide chaperone [Sphingobium subterraneum]